MTHARRNSSLISLASPSYPIYIQRFNTKSAYLAYSYTPHCSDVQDGKEHIFSPANRDVSLSSCIYIAMRPLSLNELTSDVHKSSSKEVE